jgi:hypothetical protein
MGSSGKLWTLYNGRQTASAEIHELEGGSLELNYLRDGELVAFLHSTDVGDLLRDATIERFVLEERGWRVDNPRAHRHTS